MKEPLMIREFYRFKARHGQITTLFVVILGVLLLFTTIFIDIAKVSSTKTRLNIAVDSGASMLGSLLTSYAKMLSDMNVKGGTYYKKEGEFFFSGWLFGAICIILAIICIIAIIIAAPATAPMWAVIIGGLGAAGAGIYFHQQEVIKGLAHAFELIEGDGNQMKESTLFAVVKGVVDDPVKVRDLQDINQNGSDEDWVSRFDVYLGDRLRSLITGQEILNLEGPIKEIQKQLRCLIQGDDNLDQFRGFLKDDSVEVENPQLGLWEVFTNISAPEYDRGTLDTRIIAVESIKDVEGNIRYQVGQDTKNLVSFLGYSVNSDIWDPSDPYAEVDDEFPQDYSDQNMCQVSRLIYEIYYTDEDDNDDNHFQAYSRDLLSYSIDQLAKLESWYWPFGLYDRTEGPVEDDGVLVWDKCDEMLRWTDWIEEWRGELGTKQGEVNDDVAEVRAEIARIDAELGVVGGIITGLEADIKSLSEEYDEIVGKAREVSNQIGWRDRWIGEAETEIAELEAVENPTQEQQQRLDTLHADRITLKGERDELMAEALVLNSQLQPVSRELGEKNRELPKEREYRDVLLALRGHLEGNVKAELAALSQDTGDTMVTLADYKSNSRNTGLDDRRAVLQDRAEFLGYHCPAESKAQAEEAKVTIGDIIYAWKDTKGWHLVRAMVGNFILPYVKPKKDGGWIQSSVKIYLYPYHDEEQEVSVQAWRFDEPFSGTAGLWEFYPSGRYDAVKWAELKEKLDQKLPKAGTICKGEGLYVEVKSFLDAYGMKAQAKSYTDYADKDNEKSRWEIGITDTK